MADHLYIHEKQVKSDRMDFAEIFRVPAKFIRKLSADGSQYKGALTVLEKTRKLAPEFLQQMEVINESLLVFLKK